MITGMELYRFGKETITMPELTKTTIILFNNSYLKNKFVEDFFEDIRNDEREFEEDEVIAYSTVTENESENENHKAELKQILSYRNTTIYEVDNEQTFIFTIDVPFVLQCKSPDDLWFCESDFMGKEIDIYAFTDFKGYKEHWDKGLMSLYKEVLSGRYGEFGSYK